MLQQKGQTKHSSCAVELAAQSKNNKSKLPAATCALHDGCSTALCGDPLDAAGPMHQRACCSDCLSRNFGACSTKPASTHTHTHSARAGKPAGQLGAAMLWLCCGVLRCAVCTLPICLLAESLLPSPGHVPSSSAMQVCVCVCVRGACQVPSSSAVVNEWGCRHARAAAQGQGAVCVHTPSALLCTHTVPPMVEPAACCCWVAVLLPCSIGLSSCDKRVRLTPS